MENVHKSKQNIGKSKENIGKSKENIKSKLNVEDSAILNKEPSEETLPNPNFYWGKETFHLENGDFYEGDYCCHKSGIIWREGEGTYITHDGHTYIGQWENDQLMNSPESTILFPSRDAYYGPLTQGKYSGEGTFVFGNGLILNSNFLANKPVGEVTLTDYEKHQWKGLADKEKAKILCVNHFFDSIPPERGMGKIPPKKSKDIGSVEKSTSRKSIENMESVFAKSTKTENDFGFDKFTVKSSKTFNSSVLTKDSTKTVYTTLFPEVVEKKPSVISVTLLKTFLSREYRKKNFPLKVFTATQEEENLVEEEIEEMVAE